MLTCTIVYCNQCKAAFWSLPARTGRLFDLGFGRGAPLGACLPVAAPGTQTHSIKPQDLEAHSKNRRNWRISDLLARWLARSQNIAFVVCTHMEDFQEASLLEQGEISGAQGEGFPGKLSLGALKRRKSSSPRHLFQFLTMRLLHARGFRFRETLCL